MPTSATTALLLGPLLAARVAEAVPPPPPLAALYGLIRVHQMPSLPALVAVDPGTGELTLVDQSSRGKAGLATTAGTGDLVAIDRAAGRYYYLGDTNRSRLVGVSLFTGKEVCAVDVPQLQEVQCVGCGQTLSLDRRNGSLLLSGIGANASADNAYHRLLRAPLPEASSLCPMPFINTGQFGDADFMPIAHAATYDDADQELFVTLSTGSHSYGIAVVDTASGSLKKVLPEGTGAQLVGLSWVAHARKLVGVAQDSRQVSFRTLDPSSGQWTNAPLRVPPGVNFTAVSLFGNQGAVRAFDATIGILYVLIAGHSPDSAGHAEAADGGVHLVHVDVATGTVVAAVALHGDKGVSSEILLQLAIP